MIAFDDHGSQVVLVYSPERPGLRGSTPSCIPKVK